MHAVSYSPSSVSIRFRSNGLIFNLARLRSQSKCMTTLLREFQYADECALIADSEEALQESIDSFADAASSFGLSINCKKTEVLALQNSAVRNPLSVNGIHLENVHSFKYLGSTVAYDCRLDKELDCIIQWAKTYFGRLWDRLCSSHDISNKTKLSIHCWNYFSTTLRSRNVDALSKTPCETATCPITTSTSHPPCSIYRQNHK